jgi:inorganic pyrophosphatase
MNAPPHRDPYHAVPPLTEREGVAHAVVEIPKGRRSKFEVDAATGLLRLDRYLAGSTHYPGDYGFVPGTLAEDGDPLDVLVMVNEPTFSGCLIRARVVGLFQLVDRGEPDHKLLAVPDTDPLFRKVHELGDVAEAYLEEVEHFFTTYKQLERAVVEGRGWCGRAEAWQELGAAVARQARASSP